MFFFIFNTVKKYALLFLALIKTEAGTGTGNQISGVTNNGTTSGINSNSRISFFINYDLFSFFLNCNRKHRKVQGKLKRVPHIYYYPLQNRV